MRKNQDNSAVAVETVAAAQLRIADIVSSEDGLHTVTSLRMQGAPPEMCVEFAGLAGRRHFALTASFEVLRHPQAD